MFHRAAGISRILPILALAASLHLEAGELRAPDLVYSTHCATCHAHPETKAPSIEALQRMPRSRIAIAMEFGKMQQQAMPLSAEERRLLAEWLATADDAGRDDWIERHRCKGKVSHPRVDGNGNWGFGARNTRHLATGTIIDASNVRSLKLAWALAIPQATDMRSQPLASGDTLYLGTQNGNVLALDPDSACVRWHYAANGAIRTAFTLAGDAGGGALLFFADELGGVHALDARDGELRWQRDLQPFPTSLISGSLAYHDGRLYVPLSSFEVAVAGMPTYECCRSHGMVVALDAANGAVLWRFHATPDARKTRLNAAGAQMWGPSGASIWNTPTIDAKRGLLYVGTGENTSHPGTSTSDAVIALDLASGGERWHFQALSGDVWNSACQLGTPNCPQNPGPDWDIGASVILTTTHGGRDVLLVGQKSGELLALDPERAGAVLWRRRISQGTSNGGNSGIHHGMASDGEFVYAPISDPDWVLPGYTPRPGIYALRVADGSLAWEHPVSRGCELDPAQKKRAGLLEIREAQGTAASPWPACSWFYAQSAAALLANGVVWAGALDGKLRALDARNGQELRVFETAREFSGVNGISGHGGSIDVGGVTLHGRHLFAVSGYSMFGQMPGNVLLAWELPQQDNSP